MTTDSALPDRGELEAALAFVREEALRFLDGLDERLVREPRADAAAASFETALPEAGAGALAALDELVRRGRDAVVGSAGPRFFHFVIGGATPASLAADWLASLWDQLSSGWVTSPLAVQLELVSLAWLRGLFGLGAHMHGVMTTGAMMANFTGLAAARQWWGARHGVDVAQQGLAGLPAMPVLSSGLLHATAFKSLAMLGCGRDSVRLFARDAAGRVDLSALEDALRSLDGSPAVVIANAGEVNSGDFDPITAMADLAKRYGCWLHVDGAFGLFAAVSPRTRALVAGIEHADSVTVDGHKWLNVPYDCGFSFVRDRGLLAQTFTLAADYLPAADDPRPTIAFLCPESSRRARSLSVWATLRAYGARGVRHVVESSLDLAQHLARCVDEAPDLMRLAEVPLNIVCFRYDPGGRSEAELDALNTALGESINADGRVYLGTTKFEGRVALRPAIVNWRTRRSDIDLTVDVVRELGARCAAG